MRQNCKNTIISLIKHIKNIQHNKKCTEAMLIVDQQTSALLSSVVYYFFALGVKNITKISLKKKPQPNCIGIYYLSPKSLKLISEDFKAQPIYHSINILVCVEATTQIMKQMASESKIMQRLAFFGELKLGIKYLDSNIATICEQEQLFKRLVKNDLKKVTADFANRLFESIISGYGSNFVLKVYYQNNPHISDILNHLSSRYQEHEKYLANKGKQANQQDIQQVVIRLLLVDRKIDIVSPIVRNFSFFTMVSEFFNVDYQNKTVSLKQGKNIELSFDDDIFLQYKNLPIFKAQNTIEPNFKQFKAENKAAQLNSQSSSVDKADIKHIIREIPEYNKKVASYQSQILIMYDISNLSKTEEIPQIGEVQQMIVSGLTGHGEQVKDKKILQKSLQMCNKIVNKDYAIKIYLLLILCNDLSQSDKKGLITKIKQNPKFQNLGVLLQTKLNLLIQKPMKLRPAFKKEKVFLDMHQSLVSGIVSQLIEKGTSKAVSLMVIGTEIKNEQSKFEKIQKKQIKQWLISMFGGLSINEISHLERLQTTYQNIKINMVTDRVYTTWNYIDALGNLLN